MAKKTFDEIYPIKGGYKRFDQRNTAFGQAIEKMGNVVEFGAEDYRANKMNQNIPGFSLVDYSFNGACWSIRVSQGDNRYSGEGIL